MSAISPIARISMSLAMLTLSILLTGDLFFGTRSDDQQVKMEARLRICESLAIQFSSLIAVADLVTINMSLKNLVQRDDDVVSAALRTTDGKIRAAAGNHKMQWVDIPFDQSTLTHTQVPIYKGNVRWGTVEIRFADAEKPTLWQKVFTPFVLFATYVFIVGFIGYIFYMRRTLKHLDPSAVIPDRVKAALDILTEGVMLVDTNERVVLANAAIGERLAVDSADLLGKSLSALEWSFPKTSEASPTAFPWQAALAEGEQQTSTRLRLYGGDKERFFMVNSSPIQDEDGTIQGALATFNDVTELENKNVQLTGLVDDLEASRDEVSRKNEELRVLAERDPLTNCLNRRAFFEQANIEFDLAAGEGGPLSVIMLDIDHFKKVNDTYGHGVGDEVIKNVANILQAGMREKEYVGRYGGEEFCVLLPNTEMETAAMVAERLRKQLAEAATEGIAELTSPITASLGVSSSVGGAASTGDLVDQADQALYASKDSGRNKVSRWDLI
jgi:diguanylate cyclase (GGDEF)-like protein/PAS domain S-box-containing protein